MSDFGKRLKEERERLGLSAPQFAKECGVGRTAQFNYERGERAPDSSYLVAAAQLGAHVGYILTGSRNYMRSSEQCAHAMDFDIFGRSVAAVLGITKEELVAAGNELERRMDAYGVDHDAIGKEEEGVNKWYGLYFLEAENAVKPLIFNYIDKKASQNAELLASILEGVDTACSKLGAVLDSRKKANASMMLYRAFRASGQIDQSMIDEAVKLAAS